MYLEPLIEFIPAPGKVKVKRRSVMSDSATPWTSPWNSPSQNTGVGSLSLLQGIFPTQESNPGLLHCRWILFQLSHKGSPKILEWVAYPFCRESSQPRNQTLHPLGCPLGSGGCGSFLILVFQSLGHSCTALFLNSVF